MDRSPPLSKPGLATRMEELRAAIRLVPANLLAERTGSSFQPLRQGRGELRLTLLGSPVVLTYPDLIAYNEHGDQWSSSVQALLAYYFRTSDGAPMSGKWVSFAELPDGNIYNGAFQGYSGDLIVKAFDPDLDAFKRACEKMDGQAVELGDAAYMFLALPRLPLLANYWRGDEDFSSTCKILFDSSASHYLPTDVCAILGGMLTREIIR